MQKGIQVYVAGQTLGAKGTSVSGSIGFTTTANDKYRLFIRVVANNTVNTTLYIQLEKGSSATSFEKYTNGASPNPSYPQDIEVVRGKNRLDDSSLVLFNSNKYISTSNFSTEGKIELKPNTTYTLAYIKNTLNDMGMWEFDSSNNKTAITYTSSSNGNYNIRLFTTLSTTKTMSFYARSNDTYTSVEEFLQAKELMLLEGDYSSQIIPSYLPYNTLEVVERGKNYFHLASETYTKQYGVSGVYSNSKIKINGTTTNGTNILNTNVTSIGTYKAGTYTFSTKILSGNITLNGGACAIYIRNSSTQTSETVLAQGGFNNELSNKEFTLTQNTELFLQIYCNASNVVFNNYEVGIQIEEGSSSTSFEEYITPKTYQLSLGEYEFAKIGNYVDTIEYDVENDKVYKNEKIGRNDFDENLSYEDFSTYWGQGSFGTRLTNIGTDKIAWSDMLCKYFVAYTSSEIKNLNNEMVVGTSSMIFNNPNIITLTEWITWVTTHHFSVFYPKSTSTLIEITDTTLKTQVKALYNSHSFTGTTIIEIDGQLPLIIKVRALKGE